MKTSIPTMMKPINNSTLFVPKFCNLLTFSGVEFRGGEVNNGHQNKDFSCLIGALDSPWKVNGYGADYARDHCLDASQQFPVVLQQVPDAVFRQHATLHVLWQPSRLVVSQVLFPCVAAVVGTQLTDGLPDSDIPVNGCRLCSCLPHDVNILNVVDDGVGCAE